MGKIDYSKSDIELFKMDDEGRKYLEYNDKVGGEPIGLTVPFGYPKGVQEMGGVIAVYDECIKRKITWEELLDYKKPPDDAII
jgi:hypothetical protein